MLLPLNLIVKIIAYVGDSFFALFSRSFHVFWALTENSWTTPETSREYAERVGCSTTWAYHSCTDR